MSHPASTPADAEEPGRNRGDSSPELPVGGPDPDAGGPERDSDRGGGGSASPRGVVPDVARALEARAFLRRHLPVTRMVPAPSVSSAVGRPVRLKLESELPTGSFKPRGALWALHARRSREAVTEVVASSTGNHGAAVAWAARLLGVEARIFLPEGANPVKRGRIAELGATLVETGPDLAAAAVAAREYAEAAGAFFLNDATDPDLPAGPATLGLEILEQTPEVTSIVVPVGDTALIRGVAGVAKELRPGVTIVGVQAERAPAYALSWRRGRPVETERCDTIAGGLATRTPEAANVEAIGRLVDDFVLVSEEELLAAVRRLLIDEHVVAEPAGAAALAGLLASGPGAGETVLPVTGANLSEEVLARLA